MIHQTNKVVLITSLQVGAERGTKLSVQRGAAWSGPDPSLSLVQSSLPSNASLAQFISEKSLL